MKKIIRIGLPLVAVAILSMAFLSSCGHPKNKMYKDTTNYSNTMEFFADSTVIIKGVVQGLGYYRVTGNVVIVNTGDSHTPTIVFRILDSKTLLREDSAARWKKI